MRVLVQTDVRNADEDVLNSKWIFFYQEIYVLFSSMIYLKVVYLIRFSVQNFSLPVRQTQVSTCTNYEENTYENNVFLVRLI